MIGLTKSLLDMVDGTTRLLVYYHAMCKIVSAIKVALPSITMQIETIWYACSGRGHEIYNPGTYFCWRSSRAVDMDSQWSAGFGRYLYDIPADGVTQRSPQRLVWVKL